MFWAIKVVPNGLGILIEVFVILVIMVGYRFSPNYSGLGIVYVELGIIVIGNDRWRINRLGMNALRYGLHYWYEVFKMVINSIKLDMPVAFIFIFISFILYDICWHYW